MSSFFFDYMSIPQRGIDSNGVTIERTPEEQAVFVECLPNMGTLYSIFPVLALPDVPDGDTQHNYHDSGWCTCEFFVAMLGKTLIKFSLAVLESFSTTPDGRRSTSSEENATSSDESLQSISQQSMGIMSIASAFAFEKTALREVGSKHFLQESDRTVAHGIVCSFTTKRVLCDAIRSADLREVQQLLQRLQRKGLLATLHEPVDSQLNTMLHVAVQANSVKAVHLLLKHGARATLRNLYGDTPTQRFLFPRLSSAARACRRGAREHLFPEGEEDGLGSQDQQRTSEQLERQDGEGMQRPSGHATCAWVVGLQSGRDASNEEETVFQQKRACEADAPRAASSHEPWDRGLP